MKTRILIVDDERQLVVTLQRALELEFPGCRVNAAFSGEEALSRLASEVYDLILADLRMPGFDGLELIKGVRYLDSRVPIILMTGYGSEKIREDASRLGVNHYVDKPFDVGELMEIIGELLSRREGTDCG